MKIHALAVCLAAAVVPAQAQFTALEATAAKADPAAYTLDPAGITISRVGPAKDILPIQPRQPGAAETPLSPEQIINIGERLWKIIDENRPLVDATAHYATALPGGVSRWTDMSDWRPAQGNVYSLEARNMYGRTVVAIRYQVLRTDGGRFHGKGRYLTAVTVEPLTIDVAWGFKVGMEADVPDSSIVNVGPSEDPVAGMLAKVRWSISSALKRSEGQRFYFLQGDGAFREVGPTLATGTFAPARAALDAARANALRFAR